MAVGDQADMVLRLKANLVTWFGTINEVNTPNLNALLNGIGETESYIYELITDTNTQSRIKTCDGYMLDYAARDFFGDQLVRRPGELNPSFRKRILANLLQIKATRQGMINVLTILTENTPVIIEGFNGAGDVPAFDQNLFYDCSFYGGVGWSAPYTAIIYVYNSDPNVTNDDINNTIQNTKVFGTKIYVTIFNT
jgi:hypothetical protein